MLTKVHSFPEEEMKRIGTAAAAATNIPVEKPFWDEKRRCRRKQIPEFQAKWLNRFHVGTSTPRKTGGFLKPRAVKTHLQAFMREKKGVSKLWASALRASMMGDNEATWPTKKLVVIPQFHSHINCLHFGKCSECKASESTPRSTLHRQKLL